MLDSALEEREQQSMRIPNCKNVKTPNVRGLLLCRGTAKTGTSLREEEEEEEARGSN